MSQDKQSSTFKKQVKDLFAACVDETPAQQKQLILESDYSENAKKMVLELLDFESKNTSDLTQSIKQSLDSTIGMDVIQVGDVIESYELVKPIGAGGQGEVWLAKRIDGEFTQKVAIKFIKMIHNDHELSRFQTERELLASLSHNNIAQLIGGGTYKDNRLYMILEWIDGLSIIDYVRKNLSSINDYLACFSQACEAVRYAHSKGIIHRDIKPSNIIVTNDGTVKLLDFGIAKTVDTEETNTKSAVMMTFAYSSPEQINGLPISTATDIYALGLVLYEMLTAKKAQDTQTDSHAELIQHISEITPEIPSSIDTEGNLPFKKSLFKGDLDNLVMMAIRKEPERRYATVNQLLMDITSYKYSKPLIASGDSFYYKAQKFVKRNKASTLLSLFVLITLIALPVYQYKIQKEISLQRDIAKETSDFLINILESASPLGINGKDTSLSDVLSMGKRQIQYNFNDLPQVKAHMYDTLGKIDHNLGDNKSAIELFKKSEQIYVQLNDKSGQLRSIGQQAIYSNFDDKSAQAKQLLEEADKLSESSDDIQAVLWHKIRKATLLVYFGDDEESIILLVEILNQVNKNNIQDPELLGRLYNELAVAYAYKDSQLSLKYINLSLQYGKEFLGEFHPSFQTRLKNKVFYLVRLNRYDEAFEVLNQSIELAEKLYSRLHPTYIATISEKAFILHDLGEFKKAKDIYLEVQKQNNALGKDNGSMQAISVNNLGYLYEDMDLLKQAEEKYRQSIEIRKTIDPDNDIFIALAESNLARVKAKLGEFDAAQKLIVPIMDVYKKNKRNNLYNELILIAIQIKNGKETNQCMLGLKQVDDFILKLEKRPPNSWRRMHAELWIGQLYGLCGQKEDTIRWIESSLEKSKNIYREDSDGQRLMEKRVKEAKLLIATLN